MHYNLYYILREDQKKRPIDEAANLRILMRIQEFYRQKHDKDPPKDKK